MKRRASQNVANGCFAWRCCCLRLVAGVLGWCRWVYVQIETYAGQDQAAPSDAIGVFGAAEYDGRPSPVYRARLDHALASTSRHCAAHHHPGRNGGDQYSEGAVGREYLMGMGVPEAGHHRRDREPQYRGIGPPHRRDRPRQRVAAAGDRQRRHAPFPDSCHLRRRRARRAHLAAAARARRGRLGEFERIAHEILSYTPGGCICTERGDRGACGDDVRACPHWGEKKSKDGTADG